MMNRRILKFLRGGAIPLAICALGLPLCIAGAPAGEFSFSDSFDAGGGSGRPEKWEAALGWSLKGGSLLFTRPVKGSLFPKDMPIAGKAKVEVELTVKKSEGPSAWKFAGATIYADSGNYWQLALVEAPESQKRKHAVEIAEMRDGTWYAHGKLAPISNDLPEFQWEFDHPYRLLLEIDPEGIAGTIKDKDGTECWKYGYRFIAPVVKRGKAGLMASGLMASFQEFNARLEMLEPRNAGTNSFSFSKDYSKGTPALAGDWTSEGDWTLDAGISSKYPIPRLTFLKAAQSARIVEVEALVIPLKSTFENYKHAGIVVGRDEGNFWRLSLLEKPDRSGKGHVMEMAEMKDGSWYAQSNLGQSATSPSQAEWKYGMPYVLQLFLMEKEILGIVKDSDGNTLWRTGYYLDRPAVKEGRPGLSMAGMDAKFLSVVAVASGTGGADSAEADLIPPYAQQGYADVKGRRTGFFHVEEIEGRWWMIDPSGYGYYAVGIDHCRYDGLTGRGLGYSPYKKAIVRKYGSEGSWAETALKRLKSWGFNFLGVGFANSITHNGIPHSGYVSMGEPFSFLGDEYRLTNTQGFPVFPNVFHPLWPKYCEARARQVCAGKADDPWLLGWFLDNELAWNGSDIWSRHALFDLLMKKGAQHSAKAALLKWLKGRYASTEDFNNAWGASLKSLDEIPDLKELSGTKVETVERDKVDFLRLAADLYFSAAVGAVRKADPNHMVLGCRFAGGGDPGSIPAWEAAGRHLDIVSFNYYPWLDFQSKEFYNIFNSESGKREPLGKYFDSFQRMAKRPLMITEWAFPAYDSGLPCRSGSGMKVTSQAQRAEAYLLFQTLVFSAPYIVGSDFFMWQDDPPQGAEGSAPEDCNYGIVNLEDTPYQPLVEAAQRTNRQACDIHAGRIPEIVVSKESTRAFTVKNSGTVAAAVKVTLCFDGVKTEQVATLKAKESMLVSPDGKAASAPGGHFLLCQAELADGQLETNCRDNLSTEAYYVGRPGKVGGLAMADCAVLVIGNPSDLALEAAPFAMDASKLPNFKALSGNEARIAAFDISSQTPVEIPVQLDSNSNSCEMAMLLPQVPPYGVKTVVVGLSASEKKSPPSQTSYLKTDSGYVIENGRLKLSKSKGGGKIFDEITLDGVKLGSLYPMVNMLCPQKLWVSPDTFDGVKVKNGPVRLVMNFSATCTGGAGGVITESSKGEYKKLSEIPGKYFVEWQVSVYPGKPWIESKLTSLKNLSERAWIFKSYFHGMESDIMGKGKDDREMGPYWFNQESKLAYGALDAKDSFEVFLWKDAKGIQHPDAYRAIYKELKPGESFDEPQPPLFIGGALLDGNKSWDDCLKGVKAETCLAYSVSAVEN